MAEFRTTTRVLRLTDDYLCTLGDVDLGKQRAVAPGHGHAKRDDAVSGGVAHGLGNRWVEAQHLAEELVEVRERLKRFAVGEND